MSNSRTKASSARRSTALLALGLLLSDVAEAESAAERRFNEARALDLKIRQREILRQEPDPAARRELDTQFERQRFRQWELQQRASGTAPLSPSRQAEHRQRLEREQRGQLLDFKAEQPAPAPKAAPVFEFERPLPAWQTPGFNDR